MAPNSFPFHACRAYTAQDFPVTQPKQTIELCKHGARASLQLAVKKKRRGQSRTDVTSSIKHRDLLHDCSMIKYREIFQAYNNMLNWCYTLSSQIGQFSAFFDGIDDEATFTNIGGKKSPKRHMYHELLVG